MTLRTNARIAGATYLLYLVVGISSLALGSQTQATEVFALVTSFCALVLGVTLYAITRETVLAARSRLTTRAALRE